MELDENEYELLIKIMDEKYLKGIVLKTPISVGETMVAYEKEKDRYTGTNEDLFELTLEMKILIGLGVDPKAFDIDAYEQTKKNVRYFFDHGLVDAYYLLFPEEKENTDSNDDQNRTSGR